MYKCTYLTLRFCVNKIIIIIIVLLLYFVCMCVIFLLYSCSLCNWPLGC
jgi:hypothetical protein